MIWGSEGGVTRTVSRQLGCPGQLEVSRTNCDWAGWVKGGG